MHHSPELPRMLENPSQTLPKPPPNPLKIRPKPPYKPPKSSPEASKSAFEDHSKYKHQKMTLQSGPRGAKKRQPPPKTLPKPSPDPPQTLPKPTQNRFKVHFEQPLIFQHVF